MFSVLGFFNGLLLSKGMRMKVAITYVSCQVCRTQFMAYKQGAFEMNLLYQVHCSNSDCQHQWQFTVLSALIANQVPSGAVQVQECCLLASDLDVA